jgi:glycosyltransferase involved in cell wall biosynthesis
LTRSLHVEIVEPTLVSEAGHCAALFASLRAAAPSLPYRLWADRNARLPRIEQQGVPLQRFFSRRWRKLQAPWLYRRLLRSGSPILVPTATWFDLRALDLAAGGRIPPLRAFLYFHKWRASARRAAALARLARRQPHLALFGTSEAIVQALREAGFAHVEQVMPVLGADFAAPAGAPFRALLSAGAARADKGFTHVVDLVEHLRATGSNIAVVVQASGDHYGRFDQRTRADLQRLLQLGYAHLTVVADTLDAQQYQGLFAGTICLQPYARQDYAGKMSAVTFDALRSGAPIITVSGTTMAKITSDSGAGIVVDQATPQALLQACLTVVQQYQRYSELARSASANHAASSAWRPMVEQLQQACDPGSPAVR